MAPGHSLHFWIASILGLGKSRFAPGTVATLVAGVPCFLATGHLFWPFQLVFAGLVFALGCHASGKIERELQRTDPGEAVIDELCGFLVAMLGHPPTFVSILAGFVLFRLFDIWKPWPLRFLQENLHGGMGIMMDDVGAGIYANAVGLLLLWLASA